MALRACSRLPLTLTRPIQLASRRTFATSSIMGQKHEWLLILPDGSGGLERRMSVRPQHLENTKKPVQDGTLVFGGAMLDEPAQDGQGLKINGSVMIVMAETKEEAMEFTKNDIYYKEGVWDADKIQIFPFKSAIRTAL